MQLDRKITLRLDEDLVTELQDYARKERVSVSFVLRHLVLRFLEDRRRYGKVIQ